MTGRSFAHLHSALGRRALLGLAAATAVAGLAGRSAAQSYPSHPVRVIVPFQPGSSSDTVARIVANKLGERPVK